MRHIRGTKESTSKALYGTLNASVLYFEELCNLVTRTGIREKSILLVCHQNTINSKHYTILWHVDDMMISHVDPDGVTNARNSLSKKYGETILLFVYCGKVHEDLEMVFDFNENQKVKITMYHYLDNLIE